MKRLCLVLALCFFGLTACGPEAPAPSQSPQATAPASLEPSAPAQEERSRPPELVVSTAYDADSVTLSSGNYQ